MVRYISRKAVVPIHSWEEFCHECHLHVELTIFHPRKRYCLIRIGSWGATQYATIPKEIWAADGDFGIPKLWIATVVMKFSSKISLFYNDSEGITPVTCEEDDNSTTISDADDIETDSIDEMKSNKETAARDVFPPLIFLMMIFLFSMHLESIKVMR